MGMQMPSFSWDSIFLNVGCRGFMFFSCSAKIFNAHYSQITFTPKQNAHETDKFFIFLTVSRLFLSNQEMENDLL
jgi:hypothetical protein